MSTAAREAEVVIAGAGIAASAVALRLCALGIQPTILAISTAIRPAVEAIPANALPLIEELRLLNALTASRAEVSDRFENYWRPHTPQLLEGRWIHVERSEFAAAALREALRAGARFRLVPSLTRLEISSDHVSYVLDGSARAFDAAIDATGRAAVWSRPLGRTHSAVADLFWTLDPSARAGRVIKTDTEWVYRLGITAGVTFGVVSAGGRHRQTLRPDIPAALGLAADGHAWIGRRSASHQWCESPVSKRRIAIGDAALAFVPVAGQGVWFALASASAAATLVKTWRDSPAESGPAQRFYERLVSHSSRRHERMLARLESPAAPVPIAAALPEQVIFVAKTAVTELHSAPHVTMQPAIEMLDGEYIRRVGGVDLLDVRDWTRNVTPTRSVIDAIQRAGCAESHARAILAWCLAERVLEGR